jgi:predicted Zn-dependent peptidase
MEYWSGITKKGINYICVSKKDTEAVQIEIVFKVGSRNETKETSGISHFLEHMMFQGTAKRKSWNAISEEIESFGGWHNASTSTLLTKFYITSSKNQLEHSMDILSDIVKNAVIDENEMKNEKNVIVEEIRMEESSPSKRSYNLFKSTIYEDSIYEYNVLGTEKNVLEFTRDNLVVHRNRYYIKKNILITVSGAVPANTAELLDTYFGDLAEGEIIQEPQFIQPQQKVIKFKMEKRDIKHTWLNMGFTGSGMDTKDEYIQRVLAGILGMLSSSRFHQIIREKLGLCYSINANPTTMPFSGYLSVSSSLSSEKLGFAILEILKIIKDVKTNGVTEKELKHIMDYYENSEPLWLDSTYSVAAFYAQQHLFYKNPMEIKENLKKLKTITLTDILNYAQEIFRKDRLTLTLLGPVENEEKLISTVENYDL